MPGAFLYDDVTARAASVTAAAATVPTMPLSNLQDPQPRVRTRFMGSSAAILFDLGASRPLDCVAPLSGTLTASATIRVRLSTADITGAAGDAWDSGVGPAATGDEANGNVVVVRAAGPATGRYLLVEVTDAALSEIDIGLVVAGALWRMTRAQSWGYQEDRMILDRRDRNGYTGAEFPAPALSNPRFAAFETRYLGVSEIATQYRAMVRRNGAVRDVLWVPDTGLSRVEMNLRSIWGAVVQPGQADGMTRTAFPGWSRSWRVVERL
ncbi:hypothetical protein GXW78_07500 [Roseomonas terrae]|uniref:Uncharacterized protein n=1 Tax=Neoroseomonas terrae TaxID=424799 RepID=A0ABS5EEQ2_9PROT|nr:hypothetical protein [Neoroseomonas terrae]MBR0649499.1 hypothetical protein [Neoroseomonas terrae]